MIYSIHRIIIRRLFFSWLLVSILLGALATQIASMQNDRRILEIAIREGEKLAGMPDIRLLNGSVPSDGQFATKFRQLVASHFAMGELYDVSGRKLLEATGRNTTSEMLKELKAPSTLRFRGGVDYQRRRVDDHPMLLFMLPIRESKGNIIAYFKGGFIVEQETIKALKNNLLVTVGIVLAAVLANTLILYPVILYLNRETIAFSRKVVKGNTELMSVLGSAVAKRDSDTNSHNYRVTLYSVALAEAHGLSGESVRGLIAGAFLHDVGKIGISDTILLKPARLTVEEFEVMKTHVNLGVEILKNSSWLGIARDVVEYHHEKFDGTGYSTGLSGEDIPLTARIFAIADVFDALTSERPYKKAMPLQQAMEIITNDSGTHFDPHLVSLFTGIASQQFEYVTEESEEQLENDLQQLLKKYFAV